MFGFNPKYTVMTKTKVMSLLPREIVCQGRVKPNDNIYWVPEKPAYVMKKVPSWKKQYIPEKNDCDDFVRDFRGWLSRKGWGLLLAMEAEVTLNNGILHNLIAFMDLSRTDKFNKHPLIFGEPQTGALIDIFESVLFQNVRLRL